MNEYLLLGMWLMAPDPTIPTLERVMGVSQDRTICQWNDMRVEITETPYRPRLSGDDDRTFCYKLRQMRDTGESW